MTRGVVLLVLASALAAGRGPAAAATGGAWIEVQPRPDERRVDVLADGKPFTAYVFPDRITKPVLFPLRTARGTLVTRGFPLEPRPGERVDHPHQVGLWFTHGDVNGVDFWNNSEARTPEERAKMGSIRLVAIEEARGGTDGRLRTRQEWLMPDGSVAIHETAAFSFRGDPDRRVIDRATTLTAAGRRVVFTDNKEGLFGMRVARALEEPSTQPEVFTDASGRPAAAPAPSNEGVNGVYTSSEGRKGGAVWGTRARWVALAGRMGDEDVVLLMLDHPKNPGYPSHWHARGYGLFAANPLGASVFTGGKERLDLTLEPGKGATFRHRLLILSSPFSAEAAEAAWKEFATEGGE